MAAPILQMSIPRQGELSALVRSLKVLRERAWFRASGFELEASRLPSIDDVLLPNRNKS